MDGNEVMKLQLNIFLPLVSSFLLKSANPLVWLEVNFWCCILFSVGVPQGPTVQVLMKSLFSLAGEELR